MQRQKHKLLLSFRDSRSLMEEKNDINLRKPCRSINICLTIIHVDQFFTREPGFLDRLWVKSTKIVLHREKNKLEERGEKNSWYLQSWYHRRGAPEMDTINKSSLQIGTDSQRTARCNCRQVNKVRPLY